MGLIGAAMVVVAALGTWGCGPAPSRSAEQDLSQRTIHVVATTSMLADLVSNVGGDRMSVESLMGPGVDPHLYKPSEGDVRRMAQADVIIYNGLHLEGKMTDIFDQMRSRNARTIGVAESAIPDSLLIESPLFAGNYDPHIWLSVPLWTRAARYLADTFAEMDPTHAETYRRNARKYEAELEVVHQYVETRAREVPAPQRILITSHDAFGYFGEAYGFDVRGLQGISTATEAGASDVQDLAAFVAERRVPAVFVESSVSQRGIEAVREAVRSRGFDVQIGGTLYGDALGGAGSGAETYIGMVRANIDTIVDGLTRPVS